MNYYLHQVPGRLRIKSPRIKRDPSEGKDVAALLQDLAGIETISINTMTGSVVVHHDPDMLDGGAILGVLKEHGYFDKTQAAINDRSVEGAVSRAGRALGKAIFGWAVGKVFEGSGLSFLSVLI
jgi:hypothetical protein